MRRLLPALALLTLFALLAPLASEQALDPVGSAGVARAQSALPPVPAGWPSTLQLGMSDGPGGAAAMRASAPFGFRYQYLAGGANTGNGWATWNSNGSFVSMYIQDSVTNGVTPVFTYYMVLQSSPGAGMAEPDADYTNLNNTATMTAIYNDLKLFFQKAGAFPNTRTVLHVEPDLWGYMQQRASNDNAASVSAKVAATGLSELSGLPNTVAGFAQAVVRLRNQYAPNVLLAYHISVWGTGVDIGLQDPSDASVQTLGGRAAAFYSSLGAPFDLAFAEFSDRDAAFKQFVNGDGGANWWTSEDFRRNRLFLSRFVADSQKRVAMWQIPLGNTKMRVMNNTWDHYQDNRVEWLLDDPSRAHLNEYLQAGVIGFLFGRGADGATCACDDANDGPPSPDPAPINGNTLTSLSRDDDGGFFRQKAAAYYTAGALPLSGGTAPTSTPTPTGGTATPTPTATLAAGYTTSATASPSTVAPGGTTLITASVTSSQASNVLVDLELYDSASTKVWQQWWDNQSFAAGETRQFPATWLVPPSTASGSYTIKVGIFSPGWGTNLDWNNAAGEVVVSASGPTATPTATPTPPPTATPTARRVSTRSHQLTASALVGGRATVTSSVTVQNQAGATVSGANVTVELTRPDGSKTSQRKKTNSSGQATLSFSVNRAGSYVAKVTTIAASGYTFAPSPADSSNQATVQ